MTLNIRDGNNNVYLKDEKSLQVFRFTDWIKASDFQETYEHPNRLYSPDIVYCDGAGWNGQKSRFAWGRKGYIHVEMSEYPHTNNEAEYLSAIRACGACSSGGHILSDSLLIVNQVHEIWRCKSPNLQALKSTLQRFLKEGNLSISWIPRRENKAGRVLEATR